MAEFLHKRGITPDRLPDTCPICHHGIGPIESNCVLERDRPSDGIVVEYLLTCPRKECNRLFIARYEKSMERGHTGKQVVLHSVTPRIPAPPSVSENVAALSPNFATVFRQAATAEAMGLKEVAGVGYRKALEFLVKDFCIKAHADKEDAIKKSPLMGCITQWINNPQIQQAAKLATWLGNDETHYVRLWPEHDIDSLKKLIKLTTHYIEMETLSAEFTTAMPAPRKA